MRKIILEKIRGAYQQLTELQKLHESLWVLQLEDLAEPIVPQQSAPTLLSEGMVFIKTECIQKQMNHLIHREKRKEMCSCSCTPKSWRPG
jgi:hypothetical protein